MLAAVFQLIFEFFARCINNFLATPSEEAIGETEANERETSASVFICDESGIQQLVRDQGREGATIKNELHTSRTTPASRRRAARSRSSH